MSKLPEVDATRIEVERLRALLRRYDRCDRCGWERWKHGVLSFAPLEDGLCCEFILGTPADPLETVVDGEALSDLAEQ